MVRLKGRALRGVIGRGILAFSRSWGLGIALDSSTFEEKFSLLGDNFGAMIALQCSLNFRTMNGRCISME